MKIAIDEEICKKLGMTLPEVLAVVLVKTGTDIGELFKELQQKQVIIAQNTLMGKTLLVTQRWDDVVSNIVNAYINLSLKKRNIYNTTHTLELFKLMEIKKKATIKEIKNNPYGNSFYKYLETNNSHFKKIVDSKNEEDIITSYYIYISKFQNLYYKTLHNGYIFNEYDGN